MHGVGQKPEGYGCQHPVCPGGREELAAKGDCHNTILLDRGGGGGGGEEVAQ